MKQLILSLIVISATTLSVFHSAAQNAGYDALFTNDIEQAISHFQESESEAALQGLLLAAWSRGESPTLATHLEQLIRKYPNSPYIDMYLAFFAMPELQGWSLAKRVEVLNTAIDAAQTSAVKQRLYAELADTLDMLLDPSVESASRNAGVMIDHWKLLGPFGKHGASDLLTRFEPESEIKASYEGWQREAVYQNYDPIDLTGMIELGAILGPHNTIGYLFNVIEAEADGEMWLTVQSPTNFRVWWNGEPVMEKSVHKLHTAQSHTVMVPVRQGANVITIKSQKMADWWVRSYLQNHDTHNIQWQTKPFDPQAYQNLYLKPFSDDQYISTELQGLKSEYPFAFDDTEAQRSVVPTLLRSVWHADRSQTDAARRLAAETIDQASQFALLHAYFGEQSLRLAMQRQGSKSRFQQEAESALQKALELDPLSRSALLGLQSYYMDRDQYDTSLELLENHIEENPFILSDGYSSMVEYALGILYNRKGFATEAAEQYKKVLDGYLPSYELYRHLSSFYEQNNQISKSIEMIEQGLSVFPSYPKYISDALSLRNHSEAGPNPIELYDQTLNLHPHSLHFMMAKTIALERTNQIDEAIAYLDVLDERYPHLIEWKEKKAQLAFQQGNRKAALDHYRALYQVNPLRNKAFHAMRDVAKRPDFPYMQYDLSLDDINLDDALVWENSRANSIYLLDMMVQEYYEDGTYSQYIHQAIKVLNQKGIDQWAETVIPKGVELIMARTITPDGVEWPVMHVQDLTNQQALSMYGVVPGAIVEYAYLMRGGSPDPGVNVHQGGYFFGAEEDPMLHSELTIVVPDSVPFYYDSDQKDFQPSIHTENNKKIYNWKNIKQDGLKAESFTPPLSRRVPTVHWTTVSDFNTLLARHTFSIWGYEEESSLVDQLANELLANSQPGLEYIESVFTWIRDNINDSSGGFTTADTIALQTGGQFQKLRLAKQLLAKAGIESHLAIAFPWKNRSGYGPMPDINLVGVSILIVPQQELLSERLILEFSSQYVPFKQVDPALRSLMALVYDGQPAYLEPVDPSIWAVGIIEKQAQLVVQDDLSAQINGHYAYGNSFDRQIRQAVSNPEVRQRLADQQLSNDFRGIQINEYDIVNLENFSQSPKLTFSGVIPDLVNDDGEKLLFDPVIDPVEATNFITGSERESLIEFTSPPLMAPLQIRYDLSTFVEQNKRIIVPEDQLLLSQFGSYLLTYDWQGKHLVMRRSFILYEQSIHPDSYDEFVQFCREIDEIEDHEVIIK